MEHGWYVLITLSEHNDITGEINSYNEWVGPFGTKEEAERGEKPAIRRIAYDWDEITQQYECGWEKVTSKIMEV